METEKQIFSQNSNISKVNEILYSRKHGQNQNQINIITNPINQDQNQINFINYPIGNDINSRLMNTKYVRIYPDTGCSKNIFTINTVSGRDDKERKNENEQPLYIAEERTHCDILCFGCCAPYEITFELYDITNNAKELFSISKITQKRTEISECCKPTYFILPPVYNYKVNNQNDQSNISRYDTRSFYRTYDYMGQNRYKIGEPYVPPESNCYQDSCCCCCCRCIASCFGGCCKCDDCCTQSEKKETKCCDCKNCCGGCCCRICCCCCCCCDDKSEDKEYIIDKRIYIDIFNMQDQMVGKFAKLYEPGCCCCVKREFFYEVYFPPDANELLRLALIAQILYFVKFKQKLFGVLPGSRDGIEQWIN